MKQYILIFGTTPVLSFEELQAINSQFHFFSSVEKIDTTGAVAGASESFDPHRLIDRSGGIVKIAEVLATKQSISDKNLAPFIIPPSSDKKITFGISVYGKEELSISELSKSIKELCEEKGIKARFILPHKESYLSSVVVDKQHVRELVLVKFGSLWYIGRTLYVQDFEGWNKRDFGRPYADPHKGMLPPKVARMMVNCGLPETSDKKLSVLDPFCGMGTILAEALMVGAQAYGSDIDERVVEKARHNLVWLTSASSLGNASFELKTIEATHVKDAFPHRNFTCIVTEPYLGPLLEKDRGGTVTIKGKPLTPAILANIQKGLEKLYIGSLREWHSLLESGGRVVIALPHYTVDARTSKRLVKKVIDRCENLGYTLVGGPFMYGREHALVERAIYILKKS